MSGNSDQRFFGLFVLASTIVHGMALFVWSADPDPALYARAGEVGIEVRLAVTSSDSAPAPAPGADADPLPEIDAPPEWERARRVPTGPIPPVASERPSSLEIPTPAARPPAKLESQGEVVLAATAASAAAVAADGAVPKPIGVKSTARLISEHSPLYPLEARHRGIEGRVLLRLSIDASGKVEKAMIETSSGSDLLDAAALDFGSAARFQPAIDGTNAVPAEVLLPVSFKLISPP